MNLLNLKTLSRRTFLRAGAVSLTLPLLDAMIPSAIGASSRAAAKKLTPQRMVLINHPLGTFYPYLIPETAGPQHEATRYLKLLEAHRGRYTLLSGISHLEYPNSHHTEAAIFTGVDPKGIKRADDVHNSISLDQFAMKHIGTQTRFPHLVLNSSNWPISWNERGIATSCERNASKIFKDLFINGTDAQIAKEIRRIETGGSILDGVNQQLHSLQRSLSGPDKDRLEQMTGAIRDAEGFLAQEKAWAARPKPSVDATLREFERAEHWVAAQAQWFRLIRLALQTDSTRLVVYGIGEHNQANQPDLQIGHHDASHHGKDPAKIEQLGRYEEKEYRNFAAFLDQLQTATEDGQPLLDRTQVLLTSNLGDAAKHSSDNLPTLLAGGGYKHQGHLAFDREKNRPLSNLFLRMLHQMGIEADRFGCSTGALSDLG